MLRKPKKISTFDTRFLVWFVFALALYNYGVKFILVDTQYILRTPYVAASRLASYVLEFFPTPPHRITCPTVQRTKLEDHLPLSSVPVLQYFDTGYARTLLVSKKQFNVGDIVVSGNYLIGRVTKMGNHIASVQLITDPASCVPVAVGGINGIGSGKDSKTIQINRLQVPSAACPTKTAVYTSGIDGVYPKNLLVGFVRRSTRNKINVQSCLDFKRLNQVEIISYGTT